jgi:hypothetical protein
MTEGKKVKEYLGSQMVGKSLHFKCDCTSPIDLVGTVVDYYILSNELMLKVQRADGKIYDIGENHPSMKVYETH